MDKRALREEYLSKRTALSNEILQEKSEAITALLFDNISLSNYQSLHTFLPIEKNREVNTYLIIQEIRKRYPKLVLVVPKIQASGLGHYVLAKDTKIVPGPYAVPEPEEAETFMEPRLDVILVPLLVFDRTGHRIGYGKGYYDKFLAKYSDAIKVGLSLFPPIDQIPEVAPHDVALDMVVTPEKVYRL